MARKRPSMLCQGLSTVADEIFDTGTNSQVRKLCNAFMIFRRNVKRVIDADHAGRIACYASTKDHGSRVSLDPDWRQAVVAPSAAGTRSVLESPNSSTRGL